MKARSSLITLAFAALPCACVIDGVPLPDETPNADTGDTIPAESPAIQGVYATLSSGITVVFGVPGAAPANATVVALAGTIQGQTATTANGSFNLALIGSTSDTIDVRVIVSGSQIGHTTLNAPRAASQVAPDGTAVQTSMPGPTTATSTTRVNATTVHLVFAAGSFANDASVAIADLDRGTTVTASAGPDGSLTTDVAAASGDTLYVVTIGASSASAPYVITAPQ